MRRTEKQLDGLPLQVSTDTEQGLVIVDVGTSLAVIYLQPAEALALAESLAAAARKAAKGPVA